MQAEPESNPPRRRPPYGIYAYTGREWDPEINLYYYRARYYDPKIGRFISEDPIGLRAGVNFFAYVGNRPTNRIDPSGLCSCDDPCPSGRWQFDSASFSFGLLIGQTWGFGKLYCVGNSHVSRWAKFGCMMTGSWAGISVSFSVQFRGETHSEICSPEDLPTKRVFAWTMDAGGFGTQGPRTEADAPDAPDTVSFSSGTSGGTAVLDCYIHPL